MIKKTDYRTAKFNKKTRRYNPSTTELLLEQICESFGTKLLQANIIPENGAKLVRQSKPVIVEHPTEKKRILQVQYTRFSPLYHSRALDVYNENRAMCKGKRKLSLESVFKEMREQHKKVDVFEEVTNPECIEHLSLHRLEKGLYFAVYDTDDGEDVEGKLKPFFVHESVEFSGKLPKVHITFHIEPYFVIGQMQEHREGIHDLITITFPQIEAEHHKCISSALSLHPLHKIAEYEYAFRQQDFGQFKRGYEINPSIPRQLTMGMIASYLRKFCLDRDLY